VACAIPDGFLLHRRPYRETSLLVDLFHHELGYVRAVCRGGRSAKKGVAALLQPFSPILITLSGRGDLLTLKHVEADGVAYRLSGQSLYTALYLNELLVRLLPQNESLPELFVHYTESLQALALLPDEKAPDTILRPFELALMADLGFAIDFQFDGNGAALLENMQYYWVAGEGWWPAIGSTEPGTNFCFIGADLLAIGRGEFERTEVQRAAKLICRQALTPLLGSRPLKSRELFAHFLKGKRR
jgi:DNA repair protein RecO (recombination protein O)